MHGKGEAQGSNTSADMRRRRQIVRARLGPLRYSKSALPILKIRSSAGRAETHSQHPLPSAIRRRHALPFSASPFSLPRGSPPARSRPPPSRASAISSATRAHPRNASCASVAPRPAETSSETAATTPAGDKKAAPEKAASEKSGPKGSVYAIISLPDQHITVYDATGPHRALARVDGTGGTPHAVGRVQRHRQEPLAPLEHLQRRANAVDAAHHLVGHRHARRRRARVPGFARLHPSPGRLRAADVRLDEDGRSRRHCHA